MKRFLPLLVLVAVLAGCGGGKGAKSNTPAVTSPASSTAPANTTHGAGSSSVSTSTTASGLGNVVTHGRFHYPPVLIRNYMKSCVGAAGGGGKKRDYCACTLDKLSNNVSTRDFAEIGISKTIPRRIKRFMSNAVADCANKL